MPRQGHIVEYLVGRAVSNARAAWRLIEFGHYDEALALTRGICEIGNLLWLFFVEPAELRRWLDSSDLERDSLREGPRASTTLGSRPVGSQNADFPRQAARLYS